MILTPYHYYCFQYMANLHNLINKYHGTWKFVDINEVSFINMTNYDYRILNEKNPYLKECKTDVTKLAQDLLENGMIFPIFATYNDDENKINVVLGKHRVYSLLTLNQMTPIKKKFLVITFPSEEILKDMKLFESDTEFMYLYSMDRSSKKLIPKITYFKEIMNLKRWVHTYDLAGGILTFFFKNNPKAIPNPVLNDEKLFKEFIENPLDKNNIIFTQWRT